MQLKKGLLALCIATATAGMQQVAAEEVTTAVIDDVVVTGTRTVHKTSEAPVKTVVISAEEIRAMSATNAGDILNQALGALVAPTGYSAGVIRMQGMAADHVLVMIDGQRQIPLAHGGGIDVSQIPIDDIERIEIVKGAGSALYGSDAMSGVVNIITKKAPREGTTTRYSTSFGNDKGMYHSLYNSGRASDSLSWIFSSSYEKLEKWGDASDLTDQRALRFETGYRFVPDYTSKFAVSETLERNPNDSDRKEHKQNYVFGFNGTPNDLSTLDGSISITNYNRTDNTPSKTTKGDTQMQINYSRQIGSANTVSSGYEYFSDSYESSSISKVKHSLRGYYIQDEIMLGNATFVAGGRLDDHPAFGGHFSPKASMMWRTDDALTWRISYGEAFRAPDPAEIYRTGSFLKMGPRWYYLVGNRNLEPEENKSTQAGFDWNVSNDVTLEFNYFQNKTSNLISTRNGGTILNPATSANATILIYDNINDVETSGVETMISARLRKGLAVSLSYSFTDSEVTYDDDATAIGKQLAATPEQKAILSLNYSEGSYRFSTSARYLSESFYDDANKYTIPSYTVFDMKVARSVTRTGEVFFSVKNVFDASKTYYYSATATTEAIEPRAFLIGYSKTI